MFEALSSYPMKIAYCLPDQNWIDAVRSGNPKDAAHIQQKYIAEGLRARGHSLTFIAPRDFEHTIYAHDSNTLETVSGTWTASGWFHVLSKVVWRLQQILGIPYLNIFSNYRRLDACQQILAGYNIVFERNSLYNIGVARACKKLGLPYIMFFDADQIAELDFMGKPLTGLLLWRARRLLLANLNVARRIICVSEPARDQLITTWNVQADKIFVIPNGVDVQRFRPDPELRAETRASLQLIRNPVLVFVGGFYQWHDIRILLDAFTIVLNSHCDARLILVGDGVECEKMMKHTVDLGIEQYVRFTGSVTHEDIPRYINASDITVVPIPFMKQTLWLSPMKLFEYMASGTAIVASAMGQVVNVLKDGENGLLVPAGDANALAYAINRLISDPDLRAYLGHQARVDAVRNHSWDGYILRLEQVFETTLSHQPVDAI